MDAVPETRPFPVPAPPGTTRSKGRSRSYTVSCPRSLRDGAVRLAARRGTSIGGLVRAALLLTGPGGLADLADPGPAVKQAGRDGRTRRVRRRPTVQLRLSTQLDAAAIRRLLALAVALDGSDGLRVRSAAALGRWKPWPTRMPACCRRCAT